MYLLIYYHSVLIFTGICIKYNSISCFSIFSVISKGLWVQIRPFILKAGQLDSFFFSTGVVKFSLVPGDSITI